MTHTGLLAALGIAGALCLACLVAFWRHARARRRSEEALHLSESRLRHIVDNMLVGLVTTSASGRIETANPAAERLFGYPASALIGQPFKNLFAQPDEPWLDALATFPTLTTSGLTERDGKRQNGETFPLEISVVPFETEAGPQFAAYIRDISERRDLDHLKDDFVSAVSHELRTPLTSIRAALQLVLDEKPAFQDPDHEPLLDIALNNCERLILSINDILDVSRADAGRMHLKLAPCDVGALIRSAVRGAEPSSRTAGVVIVVQPEPEPLTVSGDFDRLVQVLGNLLSNAVKFAPSRSTVTIGGARRGKSISISIRDSGAGIAEHDIGKLFDRFHQVPASAPQREGGTGLGLSIVKALVDGHGGQVTVESRPGEGSTFTVTLPAYAPARLSLAAPIDTVTLRVDGKADSSRRATVLFAEDDDDLRRVLSRSLEHCGFTVLMAPDGEVARRIFDDTTCDLIVLDLHMPGLDGFEVIRHVRASAHGAAVPIIVVSGSNTGGGELESMELGANVYMPKPVDVRRLAEKLSGLLPVPRPPLTLNEPPPAP
jgi:PAS domain S-box-containing protein